MPLPLAALDGPTLLRHFDPALTLLALAILALVVAFVVLTRKIERGRNRLLSELEAELAERRRAEAALRESELFYHSLVETIPQSILRKDLDGHFTFANGRFCAELGRTLDEILGKTDFDFFPQELASKYRRDDQLVIESAAVLDTIERHVTPQGEALYVQVIKTPLYSPDGRVIGVQGIFWDVTERVRAQEQLQSQNQMLQEMARSEHQAHQALKAAQSRLVQSEKLASLGQMVAGVAHEINNPLAFVNNNVAVLERDLAELRELLTMYQEATTSTGAEVAERLAQIRQLRERIDFDYTMDNLPGLLARTREGLRRIRQIVADLRLFARIDEGDINEVDLNEGVRSSITIIQGHAKKKGVRIEADLGNLPPVRCFAAKIHQVILNLLSNAIDACGENGLVRVRSWAEDDSVRIEVADDGCGIEPSIRSRIFDPFFTTKPVGHGTGLGLSISYGIMQDHGGSIDVESEPGKGTKFCIALPRGAVHASTHRNSEQHTPRDPPPLLTTTDLNAKDLRPQQSESGL